MDPDGADDIEEVVRQSPFPSELIFEYKRSNPTHQRTIGRPAQRRPTGKEPGAKSHKPLANPPTTPSGGSSNGSELSPYSALTAITSAMSSRTASLSSRRFYEDEMDEGVDFMDTGHDDLLVPKLEPSDDNQDMAEVDELNESMERTSERSLSAALTKTRRQRGRPRKHPKPSSTSAAKLTKERTKTGCKTCRRRKKKCDEGKPHCELLSTARPAAALLPNTNIMQVSIVKRMRSSAKATPSRKYGRAERRRSMKVLSPSNTKGPRKDAN